MHLTVTTPRIRRMVYFQWYSAVVAVLFIAALPFVKEQLEKVPMVTNSVRSSRIRNPLIQGMPLIKLCLRVWSHQTP